MSVFRFEELEGQIGLLTFDAPDRPVNTLGKAILADLATRVDELEKRGDLQGLLFISGKPGQFIAGADLRELRALATATRVGQRTPWRERQRPSLFTRRRSGP